VSTPQGDGASGARPPLLDASGLRLPREPYPGLRPFLDFEAALLFGRQRQVREIIERLAATRFVAVLGGSGSGKSSLIHAGVTPELRSYGIPGAGDLWLPMVCTPGTNVDAADRAARRHSPVTRLVRRFAKLLKSRGSAEADEQRLEEMAEVFRQEGGFARLLEAHGHEFEVPPGPDPADARVLFVIDQFEEIFHPTNKAEPGEPDEAAVLVERLLDHFFRPHPRCYVVITMRSEHLNDCAAFLELPDAINKSSFLVRRLDADELREAMVGPAQRFLRLMARTHAGTPTGAKLPAQVEFEPAVLQRLLRDVTAITRDPDHLPLLQHMLARLWQAALERDDAMDALAPARITVADLARAVNAAKPGVDAALADGVNTLRESVHNWPERIYLDHDEANRARLEALLRRLALRDPNTGHYSQQRMEAGAAAALLGWAADAAGRQQLRRLLGEGFLGTVDYLFWDAEDPERVTIKVSHESFIRGWRRFKALIDAEAVRYEEYLVVLRRCASWVEQGRAPEDLLGSGELRRFNAGAVRRRRDASPSFDDFQRLLVLDREGERLLPHAPQLAGFLDASERVERRRRQRRVLWPVLLVSAVGITLGLALPTLFALLIEMPTMRRAELLLDASGSTESVEVQRHHASRADALRSLRQLLDAAALVDDARVGASTRFGATSVRLIEALDGIALVRRQGDFLQGVLAQSEPVVIDKLREVLGTSPLFAVPLPTQAADAAPQVLQGRCSAPLLTTPQQGRILVAAVREGAERTGAQRALFVPDVVHDPVPDTVPAPTRDAEPEARGRAPKVMVYSASWSAAEGLCRRGPLLMVLDPDDESHAVVDGSLRHLIVRQSGSVPEPAQPAAEGVTQPAGNGVARPASVTLQSIVWRAGAADEPLRAQRATVMKLDEAALAQRLEDAAGPARLRAVPTWTVPAGRVLDLAGEGWRVVSWQGRRLRIDVREPDFRFAVAAAPQSPCAMLAASIPGTPDWPMRMLDAGDLCLAVYRLRPARGGPEAAPDETEELSVWAYPRPLPGTLARLSQRPLLPLAAVSPFASVAAEAAAPGAAPDAPAAAPQEPQWALGVRGEWAGWLVLRTASGSPQRAVVHGLPLTTCALWRFGQPLLGGEARPDAAQGAGPTPCSTVP